MCSIEILNYLVLSAFSMLANNHFLLLLHGLQCYTLSLAQILMEDELVIRERWRDVCLIHHQAAEARPPVGIRRSAALANSSVYRRLSMPDA